MKRLLILLAVALVAFHATAAEQRKLVIIAGKPSHPPGMQDRKSVV